MSNYDYPVVIAGAGPAGTTASLFLSEEKIPHLLLEKDVFPRDKICGDAVSGKGLDIIARLFPEEVKEFGREQDKAILSYGIRFAAPGGKHVDIAFPKPKGDLPVGFISKRLDYDDFLFRLAQRSGIVDTWQGAELKNAVQKTGHVELTILHNGSEKTVTTPLVIGADGSRSIVKRALQGQEQDDKHFSGGIRAYYKNVNGLHEENYLELHFLKELIPGYFWVFPLPNGGANVGMGMLSKDIKNGKVNLRKEMLNIIENHPQFKPRFAEAELDGKIVGWGLPLGSKKRPLSGDNYILTGDAGSLIDPFTGEGIGNATISGLVASRIAVKAFKEKNYTATALAEYDKIMYDKLWNELKVSYAVQRLTTYPWLFNFVVNRISDNKALRDIFTNMFNDLDLRAQLKNPLFYLRLLFNA